MKAIESLVVKLGLPSLQVDLIRDSFHLKEIEIELDKWSEESKKLVVTSEDQVPEMMRAKDLSKAVGKIRINVEKTRVELKDKSLREGRLIDGIANLLKERIEPIERHLKDQASFADRMKAKRMEELIAKRKSLLEAEGTGTGGLAFELMTEEEFGQMLDMAKAAKIAREEKARKEAEEAAAKAKAEAEERERQRLEMERLRKENAERERQLAEERAKAEAERRAAEARERAQRDEQEKRLAEERAKAAEEARRVKEIADKKAAEERAAREKAEAELREKEAKEEAEAKAKEEEARKLAEGPEVERVKSFAKTLRAVAESAPLLRSERLNTAVDNVVSDLNGYAEILEALCDA